MSIENGLQASEAPDNANRTSREGADLHIMAPHRRRCHVAVAPRLLDGRFSSSTNVSKGFRAVRGQPTGSRPEFDNFSGFQPDQDEFRGRACLCDSATAPRTSQDRTNSLRV